VRQPVRSGISLVELLIVLAIIGMLVTLLLPALQSGRSAARRTTCSNSLRQIGIAFQLHHTTHKAFPTNGWGYSWVGDPDRGFGPEQPGGWIFNILPFIEQTTVYQTSAGLPPESAEKKAAAARMLHMTVPGLNCPERRGYDLLPVHDPLAPVNSDVVTEAARSDFAANGGDDYCDAKSKMAGGPNSFEDATSPKWKAEFGRLSRDCNGIVHPQSKVGYESITDGTTYTYLVGEKYIQPEHYLDGISGGDKRSLYIGSNQEINRWGSFQPRCDVTGKPGGGASAWGSAHPHGFNMVFCDGSLRAISYDIDPVVHKRLSNRRDGESVDLTGLP
jgi:prepilin-type processing-associated H-X9-DG protein